MQSLNICSKHFYVHHRSHHTQTAHVNMGRNGMTMHALQLQIAPVVMGHRFCKGIENTGVEHDEIAL